MAERGGFEPPIQFNPYNGLANRRLQPLGHLSRRVAACQCDLTLRGKSARHGTLICLQLGWVKRLAGIVVERIAAMRVWKLIVQIPV